MLVFGEVTFPWSLQKYYDLYPKKKNVCKLDQVSNTEKKRTPSTSQLFCKRALDLIHTRQKRRSGQNTAQAVIRSFTMFILFYLSKILHEKLSGVLWCFCFSSSPLIRKCKCMLWWLEHSPVLGGKLAFGKKYKAMIRVCLSIPFTIPASSFLHRKCWLVGGFNPLEKY